MPICKFCGRFCGREKDLVRSHVIPKSLYHDLRDNNRHVTELFSSDPRSYPSRIPKGIYDRFMCSECECRFSPWDGYACNVLTSVPAEIDVGGERVYLFPSIDQKKLKLFFMSLLWRAHATSHSYFANVQLGQWENDLRSKLKRCDSGALHDYTVILERCSIPLYKAPHFSPFRERLLGVNFYRFYVHGFRAYIKVDQRRCPPDLVPFALSSETADLKVLPWDDTKGELALARQIDRLHAGNVSS